MSIAAIVEQQLQMYNKHDLDGFCASYADDIVIHNISAAEPLLSGKPALRARYAERFANPDLHATITGRMICGDYVVDHELVSGLPDGEIRVGVVYLVREGLIQAVWFLR